ncbi:MAG: 4-hydroxy-tetrahydrodipicolinate reductase [Tannerellaceae bacterium]|nr:4-hydroxy-tetrahydrodipicolinate reductase [Tannerellaceae bacterium]
MKIALIGYGKMGKAIERIALEREHTITSIIDINNPEEWESERFLSSDVAIEFTTPATAVANYYRCFDANIPVVSGTTGWLSEWDKVTRRCQEEDQTFFYASNFSLGVQVFIRINRQIANMMNRFPQYDVRMRETHHDQKKDRPSGTAVTLAEDLLLAIDRKHMWSIEASTPDAILIESIRKGEVPGTHEICYESAADFIRLSHEAKNRESFASGAVLAAEFTEWNSGLLGMDDMLAI